MRRLNVLRRLKGLKSQSWSLDFIIAILIFVGSFAIFYSLLTTGTTDKSKELQKEGLIITKLTETDNSKLQIASNGVIDVTKVEALTNKDYATLKSELGIKNDFCVYFEDENGNIVQIKTATSNTVSGIGSSNIKVGGNPCMMR